MNMLDNICGVLQIGLLKVPILLLDKTMGIFLTVIKEDRTSITSPQLGYKFAVCNMIYYPFYPKRLSIKVTKPLSL
jgi:hypothetical protein